MKNEHAEIPTMIVFGFDIPNYDETTNLEGLQNLPNDVANVFLDYSGDGDEAMRQEPLILSTSAEEKDGLYCGSTEKQSGANNNEEYSCKERLCNNEINMVEGALDIRSGTEADCVDYSNTTDTANAILNVLLSHPLKHAFTDRFNPMLVQMLATLQEDQTKDFSYC
eukprot:gene21035-23088_t